MSSNLNSPKHNDVVTPEALVREYIKAINTLLEQERPSGSESFFNAIAQLKTRMEVDLKKLKAKSASRSPM